MSENEEWNKCMKCSRFYTIYIPLSLDSIEVFPYHKVNNKYQNYPLVVVSKTKMIFKEHELLACFRI
jgi:hypothetical protein